LVNSGHDFESILDLFLSNLCAGKFTELHQANPKNALRWLMLSYNRAVEWSQSTMSDARRMAAEAIALAESKPWPGRTGAVDKAVFLAHCQIAYRAGRFEYAASARNLAELSGTTRMTAIRSTHRLIEKGLLSVEKRGIADLANVYRLKVRNGDTSSPKDVRKCPTMHQYNDAFRHAGLGKSALEVWDALREHGVLTPAELAKRTGRNISTIRRALKRMSTLVDLITGELLPMVKMQEEGAWRAMEVDLDQVANILGTAGLGERQHKQHEVERLAHRRSLARGRLEES
jgi:predicted transcriptional regulator